jgi:hypothetical protein
MLGMAIVFFELAFLSLDAVAQENPIYLFRSEKWDLL